ncbi:MAG: ketol-acid reductoisomerase [Planctomycetota bacterium]|nr:MAG: ketol-acid reductoisomerase [Planctomycetota bacterium]
MKLLTEKDASLEPLKGKTVAIIGYGNQGRAQGLNLRDSGIKVIVGNRDDEYRKQAIKDGFEPMTIAEAAEAGDILHILTTDESQPVICDDQIAPGIQPGNTLMWGSGYNVGFNLIKPPTETDAIMIAPRMTGNMVRELFQHGKGAIAQCAIHQDATGHANETMLALCKGIGLTRGGVFMSTFREEAELDLFAEQVYWPVLAAWVQECFKMGVEFGFSPELMVMELYASSETSEIMGLMAKNGFFKQMSFHSTTSQYGTLSRCRDILNDEIKSKSRERFLKGIRGGEFIKEWSHEQATGLKRLADLLKEAHGGAMSQAEKNLIPQIQSAHSL